MISALPSSGDFLFQPLRDVLGYFAQVIAPLRSEHGGAQVAEVVERVFLACLATLLLLPTVLIACFGFPLRALSNCCRENPVEQTNNPVSLSKMEEEDPLNAPIPKEKVDIKRIPPDGNCAFFAFLEEAVKYGLSLPWTIDEFREKSADWIFGHLQAHPQSDLRQLLIQSAQEYAEVKQQRLLLASQQGAEVNEKELAEATRNTLTLEEDMLSEYLVAIRDNKDERRVHASRAHYYAWCHMFPMPFSIIIYAQRDHDYNPIAITKRATKNIIRFLHVDGNHIDLLHVLE